MTSLQFGTMWTSYSRQHEQIQKAAGDRSGCKTWLCEEPQRLELLEKSVLTLRFFPEHASWCFYSAVTPPRMFPAKGSSDEVSALAFVNFSREKKVFFRASKPFSFLQY